MQQAIQHIQQSLEPLYPERELRSISRLLVSKITGYSFTEIILNKNTIFSAKQRKNLDFYLEKLQTQMPIQYVLGDTEFCGLSFIVDESVLIPRPETEELVEWLRSGVSDNSAILDIGTGSGCIAVSLKHFLPQANIAACDVSLAALQTAQKNADLNQVNIEFFQADILVDKDLNRKWDVIVSNPPYIPEKEKQEIEAHVLDYEPGLALFVPDNDPLIFYKKIGEFAHKHLHPKGKIYLECHRDYAEATAELYESMGFKNIKLKKDINGNLRMLRASF